MMDHAAGTYVQITREDLEGWLTDLKHPWKRDSKFAGVYLIMLGENVAVKLSSTIGSKDDAMGRGEASMQLALVSTVTGQVLNKKAQGQSHFARTLKWMTNWKAGVDRMQDAYKKSQGFYDALAAIKDREKYKQNLKAMIESIPGWSGDSFLVDLHGRVINDGILTVNQEAAIQKRKEQADKAKTPRIDEALIQSLRELYVKVRRNGDHRAMEWLESVANQLKAGRTLSPKQEAYIKVLAQ